MRADEQETSSRTSGDRAGTAHARGWIFRMDFVANTQTPQRCLRDDHTQPRERLSKGWWKLAGEPRGGCIPHERSIHERGRLMQIRSIIAVGAFALAAAACSNN